MSQINSPNDTLSAPLLFKTHEGVGGPPYESHIQSCAKSGVPAFQEKQGYSMDIRLLVLGTTNPKGRWVSLASLAASGLASQKCLCPFIVIVWCFGGSFPAANLR